MEAITENRIFKIRRNLSDAGCEEALIQKFLSLDQKQEREEQYRLLSRHRAALLENLHQDQYKIDCLDYMVYTMKKEENGLKGGFEHGRKTYFNRRMGQNISQER